MRGVYSILSLAFILAGSLSAAGRLDPAGWGSDHVGKPLPEYTTGDECLFCHRNDVGPAWSNNRHQLTVREPEPGSPALAALPKAFASEVTLLLGGRRSTRFLKKSPDYGKVELLSTAWGADGKLHGTDHPHWEKNKFADACAGCHATGVDPQTRAFSVVALDCYVCHGLVGGQHAKEPQQVRLSKRRPEPARLVTSVCAQCHVRSGKSRTTGLPYPDNFVAGDNLFRDFQVELSPEAIRACNPADRHVLENVRDVAVLGKVEVTCLSCHDIHKQSSRKHVRLRPDDSCLTCHNATGPKKILKPFEVHSRTCEY